MQLAGCAFRTDPGRSELESGVVFYTIVYSPIAQGVIDIQAHTAGSYQYATGASLRLDGRVSFASCASLP
jgi:hypothetical protein